VVIPLQIPIKKQKNLQSYVNVHSPNCFKQFTDPFYSYFSERIPFYHSIIILCIGTDRSTGDSLGPLIGYKLKNLSYPNVFVYGTLDEPVHAKNLKDTMTFIHEKHPRPMIIAIDACLGKMEHIGYLTLGVGSIKPGAGVHKSLPAVGDLYITGIVNFSGFMDMLILQNTRLSLVMKMADAITSGIKYSLWKYFNTSSPNGYIQNTHLCMQNSANVQKENYLQ
jgi:putative sporulation protein YyaC